MLYSFSRRSDMFGTIIMRWVNVKNAKKLQKCKLGIVKLTI